MMVRQLPGHPGIEITLRRSSQARRFSLRVSRLDGRVTLSLPARAREGEALAFAAGQADWIRRMVERAGRAVAAGPGAALPFEGRMVTVTPAQIRAPRIEGEALLVPEGAGAPGARVQAFLKVMARQRLSECADRHAGMLGRPYLRLTLRDPRSRWGSCAADGSLMFSWRLIMAPPEVLDYVAAHEVAHLAEMNHSEAFWAVVAGLMPGYAQHRAWLKKNGTALHGYRFAD